LRATFKIDKQRFTIDLEKPLDISIPLRGSSKNPVAWYVERPSIAPVQLEDWVGSVKKGASVNFNTISFNPHAHGTHTECFGHISETFHSVHKVLKRHFFTTELISVAPETRGEDQVISETQIRDLLEGKQPEALVIRTLPNTHAKKQKNHSHTHWPYLTEKAALFIRKLGVQHLLIDLPSVDKEKDDGALLAHKAFWDFPKNPRKNATITEFVYVNNHIKDGNYILNLQTAPFVNDATPSRPLLYKILTS
tara:strand:+ start:12793 stop:13545 length:753 start_codon:yes stop_codon:yes gene_type:complete